MSAPQTKKAQNTRSMPSNKLKALIHQKARKVLAQRKKVRRTKTQAATITPVENQQPQGNRPKGHLPSTPNLNHCDWYRAYRKQIQTTSTRILKSTTIWKYLTQVSISVKLPKCLLIEVQSPCEIFKTHNWSIPLLNLKTRSNTWIITII